MSSIRVLAATSVAAAASVFAGAGAGVALASGDDTGPRGDTIVEVTGDRANGFEIRHHDGTTLYPPTGSEARAECSEYDTRVDRVRCRTEIRVWYRDLGDIKRALNWAHSR